MQEQPLTPPQDEEYEYEYDETETEVGDMLGVPRLSFFVLIVPYSFFDRRSSWILTSHLYNLISKQMCPERRSQRPLVNDDEVMLLRKHLSQLDHRLNREGSLMSTPQLAPTPKARLLVMEKILIKGQYPS